MFLVRHIVRIFKAFEGSYVTRTVLFLVNSLLKSLFRANVAASYRKPRDLKDFTEK